jgi:hypothetical protein
MKKERGVFISALAAVFLAFAGLAIFACQTDKQPIKVGFVGGLTGRYSDLGVADALKVNDSPSRLKDTILGLKKVHGLFGDFSLNRFGDSERSSLIMSVKNGRYCVKE